MSTDIYREKLKQAGLKVTPQRLAIYETVLKSDDHPSAEKIIDCIKTSHPNISIATVYKVLDTLVENKLLIKVKNEKGTMRYDAVISPHHHLYCTDSDRIEDFEDEYLDKIISGYFKKKKIKNFKIRDIRLQITGKFSN
jgi:Fur family peroxide stress response transcriptional regulator